nr:hypothetical protein [uncultured Rhodopila sp.]
MANIIESSSPEVVAEHPAAAGQVPDANAIQGFSVFRWQPVPAIKQAMKIDQETNNDPYNTSAYGRSDNRVYYHVLLFRSLRMG